MAQVALGTEDAADDYYNPYGEYYEGEGYYEGGSGGTSLPSITFFAWGIAVNPTLGASPGFTVRVQTASGSPAPVEVAIGNEVFAGPAAQDATTTISASFVSCSVAMPQHFSGPFAVDFTVTPQGTSASGTTRLRGFIKPETDPPTITLGPGASQLFGTGSSTPVPLDIQSIELTDSDGSESLVSTYISVADDQQGVLEVHAGGVPITGVPVASLSPGVPGFMRYSFTPAQADTVSVSVCNQHPAPAVHNSH